MPVYEYVCSACDHRADILHGLHDPGPNFCPSCGTEGTMRKTFAAPAVHFKGSGWAKKDRAATSSRGKRAKGSDGSDSTTEPASTPKTDAGDSPATTGGTD